MNQIDPRDRGFADLEVGEKFRPLHIEVTQKHIRDFQEFLGHFDAEEKETACLFDSNLHIDEDFSRKNMYGGVVGIGHQTIQYLCQVVTDSLPWGTLVSGHSSLDVKMTNPTRPGDEVVATGKIVDKVVEDGRNIVVCEVRATKQDDMLVAIDTIRAGIPG